MALYVIYLYHFIAARKGFLAAELIYRYYLPIAKF